MAPRRAVALVALATTASVSGWWLARTTHELTAATVTNAVDGDTLEVQYAGRRDTVRLLGVDTPETVHPDRPVECFGPEASAFTHAQLDVRHC
ncbi:MAG: thermonuclease family protein [Actinobacteria bacterium]|nr:thermonuclease family protein [Actinomycetota bacterium]